MKNNINIVQYKIGQSSLRDELSNCNSMLRKQDFLLKFSKTLLMVSQLIALATFYFPNCVYCNSYIKKVPDCRKHKCV